jgi:3'-phosphoadenosine 5'-phosphosulfate sulfotransferase (PAPS reductase)/FAD synthetase
MSNKKAKPLSEVFGEEQPKPITSISYGGGVQSTAMLVLAAQGKLGYDVDVALFANVGDDSEHPATLQFIEEVAKPFAKDNGIEFVTVQYNRRNGDAWTLKQRLNTPTKNGRSADIIPVYTPSGMPFSRGCTADFKIRPIGKWLRKHGASEDNPATVCIGISTDEITRIGNKKADVYERPVYPLVELGIDRARCQQLIADAGLRVPPKSSCYFCPFHRPQTWAEMRRDEPELFWSAAELEQSMNDRRDGIGREPAFLTRFGKPLPQAIPEAQDMLPGFEMPGGDGCDSGYCWT